MRILNDNVKTQKVRVVLPKLVADGTVTHHAMLVCSFLRITIFGNRGDFSHTCGMCGVLHRLTTWKTGCTWPQRP
jgi:hypothetical protein